MRSFKYISWKISLSIWIITCLLFICTSVWVQLSRFEMLCRDHNYLIITNISFYSKHIVFQASTHYCRTQKSNRVKSFQNNFNGVYLIVIIFFEFKIYKLSTLDLREIELHMTLNLPCFLAFGSVYIYSFILSFLSWVSA
jgi:hypothetical protein